MKKMENFTFTFTLDNNKENGEESSTSFRKKDFKATSFTKTREEKQEERRRKILREQRQVSSINLVLDIIILQN